MSAWKWLPAVRRRAIAEWVRNNAPNIARDIVQTTVTANFDAEEASRIRQELVLAKDDVLSAVEFLDV